MKTLTLFISLIPSLLLSKGEPPTTWDHLKTIGCDDLGKAEYYMDKYPHPPARLKDQIWMWMRNGFRGAIDHRNTAQKQLGQLSEHNVLLYIDSTIDERKRWARVFSKAVANNIKPVIDDELYEQWNQDRQHQNEIVALIHEMHDPSDPE